MADLVFIAVTLAFFGLALLLIRACDRIIGPDPESGSSRDGTGAPSEPAATAGGKA